MGIYLPVPVVAAVLAYFYGRTIHNAWLPAVITFVLVLVGGLLFQGVGQIAGVVVSALLIFLLTREDEIVRLSPGKLRIDREILAMLAKIGLPSGFLGSVFSISNVCTQSAINSLGTVVIAASSAAFNIEVIAYDVMNSFSQACTTFVGQNYGAGQIKRCKRTLWLTLIEDTIASGAAIGIVLLVGRFLLSIFNSDPQVIEIGYTRLVIVFSAYTFSMLYEIMSGYLRGFGVSLVPAVLTMIGVCGIRIAWIELVFPKNHNFETIMMVYPISLAATALLIFIALLIYRPSHRFANKQSAE